MNRARCTYDVHDAGRGVGFHRCVRNAMDGNLCKIHTAEYIEKKAAERQAAYEAAWKKKQKAFDRLPNAVKLLRRAYRDLHNAGTHFKLVRDIEKYLKEVL